MKRLFCLFVLCMASMAGVSFYSYQLGRVRSDREMRCLTFDAGFQVGRRIAQGPIHISANSDSVIQGITFNNPVVIDAQVPASADAIWFADSSIVIFDRHTHLLVSHCTFHIDSTMPPDPAPPWRNEYIIR